MHSGFENLVLKDISVVGNIALASGDSSKDAIVSGTIIESMPYCWDSLMSLNMPSRSTLNAVLSGKIRSDLFILSNIKDSFLRNLRRVLRILVLILAVLSLLSIFNTDFSKLSTKLIYFVMLVADIVTLSLISLFIYRSQKKQSTVYNYSSESVIVLANTRKLIAKEILDYTGKINVLMFVKASNNVYESISETALLGTERILFENVVLKTKDGVERYEVSCILKEDILTVIYKVLTAHEKSYKHASARLRLHLAIGKFYGLFYAKEDLEVC